MKYYISILFILFQFVTLLTFAQNQQLRFERIGVREGLSDINVVCMMQDSHGFMWIGTRYGLNRYDGRQFKVFYSDPVDSGSLSSNFIQHITEDSKGNIWIATLGGGFNKFDRKKNRFKRYIHQTDNPNSVSENNINNFLEDRTGKFWIATNEGVNLFDPETNRFTRFFHNNNDSSTISDNNVTAALIDKQGDIWFGTQNGGLNRLVTQNNTFIHYKADSRNQSAISGNSITAIFEDSNNRLWIGTTSDGLNLLDRFTGKFSHFYNNSEAGSIILNNILRINEDDNNNLWIGTEHGGISIFNYKLQIINNYTNDEIDDNSLSSNSIASITKDSEGNMWVGLFAGGINLCRKSTSSFKHFKHNSNKNSLSNNFVLCILEDENDKLWIGTDGGGLNLFDMKTGKSYLYKQHRTQNSIAGNYILSLAEDNKNNLWIGTWGDGLSKLNLKTQKFTNFKYSENSKSELSSNNIYAITVARNGKIWIGTFDGGLNVYNEQTNRFINYKYNKDDHKSLSSNLVYSIIEDKSGKIWIGTFDRGINLFDPMTNSFIRFNKENNSLTNNSVPHLLETKSGLIYACTMGGGLHYFDSTTNRFIPINPRNKFASEYIYAALVDQNGNIWVSTNKGISKYNSTINTIDNYSTEDGLQGDEFKPHSAFKGKSGLLYFGGINGYNSFLPDQIIETSYNPPIVLTDFQILNKSVLIAKDENDPSPLKQDISETKSLRLSYKESVFTFGFASLDYAAQDHKVYAYLLEGFDRDWNIVGSKNSATYTNLNHGNYIFKVKSQNRSGEWNEKGVSLKIIILPPWWKTMWFKGLAIISIILAIFIVYYLRLEHYRKNQKKLSLLVEKRTQELTLANNELLERQILIEDQSEELRAHAENLKEANDLLVEDQSLIKLQTDIIQEANAELTKLNTTKDRILSIIGHDLRNPFNAISGFSELLLEDFRILPPETIETHLNCIFNSSNNGNTLLTNLLEWSRTQVGGIAFDPAHLNLLLVARETFNFIEGAALKKNISILLQIDPEVYVEADENMLKTILRNLLSNALKFTYENGNITIYSSIKSDYVEICVSDSGVGIPEEKIPLLFNINTNISTRGTSYETGTGLGLILCKEFVEKHNGKIWVESKVGIGSQFKFTLPIS